MPSNPPLDPRTRGLRGSPIQHNDMPPKKAKMAAKRGNNKKATAGDLIISKSRTKAAVRNCNVSGDFYGALDAYVRNAIKGAEARATQKIGRAHV